LQADCRKQQKAKNPVPMTNKSTLQTTKYFFSILAGVFSMLVVKATDGKIYEENFNSSYNLELATNLNATFNQGSQVWASWSNSQHSSIGVVDWAFRSAPSALKVVNHATCGFNNGVSSARSTSPVIMLGAHSAASSLKMEYWVFSYDVNNAAANNINMEFFNGSTWVNVWSLTGAQFNTTIGLNNWVKITLDIPASFRNNNFRYRITGNMNQNVCANQYIYVDDIAIKSSLGVLPVDVDFSAQAVNGANQLSWINFSEGGNLKYEVERSGDGRNFSTIGSVVSQNTTGRANYGFTDQRPLSAINYYRIAIKTRTGKTEYTPIRVVSNRESGAALQLFPNPVVAFGNVQIPAAWQQTAIQVQVVGVDGRILVSQQRNKAAATEWIGLSQLPAGNYRLLVTQSNTGERLQLPFLKN
jgi:hypothetical protein